MKRYKSKNSIPFVFFIVLIVFLFFWILIQFFPVSGREADVVVTIEEGQSLGSIAQELEEQGAIRSSFAFKVYALLKGADSRLRAGNYVISEGVGLRGVIGMLMEGEEASERTVTIIEGLTLQEIDDLLTEQNIFQEGELSRSAREVRNNCNLSEESCLVIDLIPAKIESLEGYLFPDTYRLFLDAAPEDLIDKMLKRFYELVIKGETGDEINNSQKSLHENVTMASIIEAEVPHEEDRALVAGLLWKRMDAGMPLQVDATINYITGKRDASATLEDLKIDSFYNTYLYPDLPPGPINNPGISAIGATLNPEFSEYWFYLSAKDGTTIFSHDFEEHKAAKTKYLK